MKKRVTLFAFAMLFVQALHAQDIKAYTTAQAHSHNDYERRGAFQDAYNQQFGSIEADVFLVNDTLYVAHHLNDIKPGRTLSALYLKPILAGIEKNDGNIYPQKEVQLQLLIDLKTTSEETLAALVKELEPHKHIFTPTGSVKVVVSGNTPDPASFDKYPEFLLFDGRPEMVYTPDQLKRIGLISQAFAKYSKWNGEGPIPEKDKKNIQKVIKQSHDLGKKVRLWATPDNINSWKIMMTMGVDYLNTDKVNELGDYLRTAPR
jgi:hypothetical protein